VTQQVYVLGREAKAMPSTRRPLTTVVGVVAAAVGLAAYLQGWGGFESSSPALTAVGVGVALVAVVVTVLRSS
jgi:hypothetical protein